MNALLWILQILLAVSFGFTGVMHLIVPPGLPAPMAWMYDLPGSLHVLSGTAEILAALGLALPGLTRIAPRLTPLAAWGLLLVMAGAIIPPDLCLLTASDSPQPHRRAGSRPFLRACVYLDENQYQDRRTE